MASQMAAMVVTRSPPWEPSRLGVEPLCLAVNAWLFNSKDSVAGNCKTGTSFWGQIAATFNSTSDPARHRTSKQLKDHWNAYNKEVSLFNAFHIQESALRQSGADDDMVMKATMERYANDKRVTQPFRRHHWWLAVRNEAKWKGQHGPGSGTESTSKRSRLGLSGEYSSSEATTEEERPTGRDRAKAAARKGRRKGKDSSSSSEAKLMIRNKRRHYEQLDPSSQR
nr:glutathione S-transferase T3-like [Lolium perenne]